MNNNRYIEDALANGYNFNISSYLSRGLDIFKKNPGGYIGYTLLFFIISMTISFIPILGTLIGIAVNPALTVGAPIAAHMQEKYSDREFGNFFKGFEHFAQLLVANILVTIIYLITALPLIFMLGFTFFASMASGDPEALVESIGDLAGLGIWIFVFILLFTYLSISLRWTNYLIVFHQYDAVSAIKTSWALTNRKWFLHLGFVLLAGLIMILGVFALIVGIIFVIPIIFAADYAGFADVTGLNRKDDIIDEIGRETDLV
jgi:hypothetical protein